MDKKIGVILIISLLILSLVGVAYAAGFFDKLFRRQVVTCGEDQVLVSGRCVEVEDTRSTSNVQQVQINNRLPISSGGSGTIPVPSNPPIREPVTDVADGSFCEDVFSCDFNSNAQELVFLDLPELIERAGSGIQRGDTGSETCEALGYSGCFATQMDVLHSYYSSIDGSCTGSQYWDRDILLQSCDQEGYSGARTCQMNPSNADFVEPLYGDSKQDKQLIGVICIK